MKKRGKEILSVAAVIALGGGASRLFGEPSSRASVAKTSKTGVGYSRVRVTRGDIVSTLTASGQLQPRTIITIKPDSNMPTREVVKVMQSEGQQLAADEALVKIDPTGLDLALKSAEATYQAAVATARFNCQVAAVILKSTIIRSARTGTVAEIPISEGDLVSTSTAIAYVVNTDPMDLVTSVNESDISSVKKGQTATVTQSAYFSLELTGVGKGTDLHASISNSVSTFSVTPRMPNNDGKLLWA